MSKSHSHKGADNSGFLTDLGNPELSPPRKTLVIRLPLPYPTLQPNARVHWATRARDVQRYRKQAWAVAFSISKGAKARWPRATAQATFHFSTRRRRDRDNLLASLKAAFDGLVDAGVIADDSGLTHLPVIVAVDGGGEPRVEISIAQD